ncbi:unnamed protein product [Vicia faba]|uniref:Uncharacterized protein n=1 Tax=Vicia faba TaxID=3906 RepID=A0AAV0ZLC8_VICFA|nr:unnamed protein product [Vicia faba]
MISLQTISQLLQSNSSFIGYCTKEEEVKIGNDEDEDENIDPYGGLSDDEQKKILCWSYCKNMVDIDVTFQELKETDIGKKKRDSVSFEFVWEFEVGGRS